MLIGAPIAAMASELSSFIENELRSKGYAYDEDDAEANDNPHTSLIGALRVEVWPPGRCPSWMHTGQGAIIAPVQYRCGGVSSAD